MLPRIYTIFDTACPQTLSMMLACIVDIIGSNTNSIILLTNYRGGGRGGIYLYWAGCGHAQVYYRSLAKEGPLWIVRPSPSFSPNFLLRSKTYLKERPPSASIANREFLLSSSLRMW